MFADTSVLIEMLTSKPTSEVFYEIYKHIEEENIFISAVQLGEISDWCFSNDEDRMKIIPEIKEIVEILELNEEIVMNASLIKYERRTKGFDKFGLIDGIVMASSRSINEVLLTFDNDFRNLDDVILLEK